MYQLAYLLQLFFLRGADIYSLDNTRGLAGYRITEGKSVNWSPQKTLDSWNIGSTKTVVENYWSVLAGNGLLNGFHRI